MASMVGESLSEVPETKMSDTAAIPMSGHSWMCGSI